jgi:hypothetical protein
VLDVFDDLSILSVSIDDHEFRWRSKVRTIITKA